MNYREFLQVVEQKLQEEIGENITIMQRETMKNNGVIYKGILFCQKDINISPTIYMEEFYKAYCKGEDVTDIIRELLRVYDKVRFHKPCEGISPLKYDWVKDKIVMRLVNMKYNEEQLKDISFVPYLDLAVVFHVLMDVSAHGIVSMMIRKEHMEMWGVTEKELYDAALKNAPVLLPYNFFELSSFLCEKTGVSSQGVKSTMFVLSNKIQNYGASVILYPGCLEEIGNILESDFYLIPSSVHEMLVVPKQFAVEEKEFCEMIRYVNCVELEPDEVLSDHPYFYDYKSKSLKI